LVPSEEITPNAEEEWKNLNESSFQELKDHFPEFSYFQLPDVKEKDKFKEQIRYIDSIIQSKLEEIQKNRRVKINRPTFFDLVEMIVGSLKLEKGITKQVLIDQIASINSKDFAYPLTNSHFSPLNLFHFEGLPQPIL
jgi:DNA repair exonuclease SbcCD nuclease subunit